MLLFAVTRLAASVVLLWVTASLAFLLVYLAPGDPARTLAARAIGRLPPPELVAAVRAAHGLDRSPLDQYRFWLGQALQGDLGKSFRNGRPIAQELGPKLGKTLQLTTLAFLLAAVVALPLGLAGAARPGGMSDRLSQALALLAVSLPSFWVGFVLILLFASRLGWLPTHGAEGLPNLVLPVATLALAPAARLARLTRAAVGDALILPHVLTARAKGLGRATILCHHGLRLAAVPLLVRLGLEYAFTATGAVVVETVFAWPGLGNYFVQSVQARDLPAIQGLVLAFGAILVVATLVADVLSRLLDPRLRVAAPRA